MELKHDFGIVDVVSIAFYSYLYGIETRERLLWIQASQCFTRTFMELKHLTRYRPIPQHTVLLVPLWNWNVRPVGPCAPVLPFYSYLYGIETEIPDDTEFWTKCVLLVPLWNWNYEQDKWLYYQDIVLLVPLWNWNLIHIYDKDSKENVLLVPLWNWNDYLWI